MHASVAERNIRLRTRRTLRFIGISAAVYLVAGAIAALGMWWLPPPRSAREALFPPVFVLTSLLLVAGSLALHRAIGFVRREEQPAFRRSLWWALAWGVLFVGLQACGLKWLIDHQHPGEAQTGSNAFLVMMSGVHALHFTVAIWWLLWVLLSALEDRYDHEYYWGVYACGWFWHALGAVWAVLLAVFLIAANFQ